MAPPYKMIASLTSHSKTDVLFVRATRIWESINTRTGKLIRTNVVFLDEEDSHIVAIIYNNQKDTYFPDNIKEGLVYTISDFIVTTGPKEYRAVDRDVVLNFYHKTEVVETEDTGKIPRYKFELTELEKVPALVSQVRNFIDVIGMVEIYADAGQSSKGDKKLEVRIINHRKTPIMITLWQAKATQFMEEIECAHGSAAFVVITGLLAKKISDETVLSSRDSTKTYCNIDYAPLTALKEQMFTATGCTVNNLPPPTKSGFMTAAPITLTEVSIQHILDTETPMAKEVIHFLCKATITNVLSYDGWFYNSCPKCPRGVELQGDKYFCVSCGGPADKIKQRYRVKVMVEDDSGKTTFTLFRNQVEQLIGVPIEKIVAEIGQDKITEEIPPVIKNMIGKLCVFEVKVNSYNKPGRDGYTVTRLSGPPPESASTVSHPIDGAGPSKKQRID